VREAFIPEKRWRNSIVDFFDLVNISERYLEHINPITTEKVLAIGRVLNLQEGKRVIDFGSGYAEALVLWAEQFGISGIGIDIREHVCERARKKISDRGLGDRIQIVCGKGAEYPFEGHGYDAAVCLGATFIWKGFEPTIRAMAKAIPDHGRLAVGEPYWLQDEVPPEYVRTEQEFFKEHELLQIIRESGFDLVYLIRASQDDWDQYEAGNWLGLVAWLKENPEHPERQQVMDHLHKIQDEYLRFGRQYLGWAVYILEKKNR
jgi:SAM-dependent methyltransferase